MKWFSSYPSVPVIRIPYFRPIACTDTLISAVYVLISWLNLWSFPFPKESLGLSFLVLKRHGKFPLPCSLTMNPEGIDVNLNFTCIGPSAFPKPQDPSPLGARKYENLAEVCFMSATTQGVFKTGLFDYFLPSDKIFRSPMHHHLCYTNTHLHLTSNICQWFPYRLSFQHLWECWTH